MKLALETSNDEWSFSITDGAQVMIEDYVHGLARKVLIIAMICLSYAAAAAGVFAVIRLAL